LHKKNVFSIEYNQIVFEKKIWSFDNKHVYLYENVLVLDTKIINNVVGLVLLMVIHLTGVMWMVCLPTVKQITIFKFLRIKYLLINKLTGVTKSAVTRNYFLFCFTICTTIIFLESQKMNQHEKLSHEKSSPYPQYTQLCIAYMCILHFSFWVPLKTWKETEKLFFGVYLKYIMFKNERRVWKKYIWCWKALLGKHLSSFYNVLWYKKLDMKKKLNFFKNNINL
jgi:hypothetical protein